MEEEYRMQKAQTEISHAIATTNDHTEHESGDVGRMVIHEDGRVVPSSSDSSPRASDDNASTRAMVSPTIKASSMPDINGSSLDVSSAIPTIRVSTESDHNGEEERTEESLPSYAKAQPNSQPNGVSDTLEKPVQAAAGEGEQPKGENSPLPAHEPFSFSNKRLCERWLDNLFMVLYEVN
jgi:Chs5-Arf1p-binding protein BUD7/BCH1